MRVRCIRTEFRSNNGMQRGFQLDQREIRFAQNALCARHTLCTLLSWPFQLGLPFHCLSNTKRISELPGIVGNWINATATCDIKVLRPEIEMVDGGGGGTGCSMYRTQRCHLHSDRTPYYVLTMHWPSTTQFKSIYDGCIELWVALDSEKTVNNGHFVRKWN